MNHILFKGNLISPTKIICVGRNYVEHIKELGNDVPEEMVVFFKPASAISDQLMANLEEPLHYEAELSFIIKDGTIVGVGIGLDITKRTLQNKLKAKGLPWERAKAFNGAAVFSPFITLSGSIKKLNFELLIDGQIVQQGNPAMMIYPPSVIIEELNKFTHLDDNDIIMTGTPAGVGQINAGSKFNVKLFSDKDLVIDHSWLAH